ncbi:Ig-like domain-containing protein [Cohnella panacarvi]|uniref:Ig-like domain-containing protein n=1 Tax=Cohnella panacarvi TaxID=400776 RepID=UPI00047D4220|nr:Ig-like domain-containing protein [Cohnella panacarvi]
MPSVRTFVRLLIVLFVLSNLFIFCGFPRDRASAAATVEEGDFIAFGSYWGYPLRWQVINIDANSYMLFAYGGLGMKPFDAVGDGTDGRSDTDRINNGSSYWEKSNLREWLNSSEQSVTYSHQAPDADHVLDYPYSGEPGFLSDDNFTAFERSLIQPVTHKSIIAPIDEPVKDGGTEDHSYDTGTFANAYKNYDNAIYKNTTDLVSLLSIQEFLDLLDKDAIDDGKDFAIHSISQYWLRDAMTMFSDSVRIVGDYFISSHTAKRAAPLRPVVYLNADVKLVGVGTLASPYTIDTGGAASSSLSSSASTLAADGTDNATLTVTRLDAFGQPVAGHNVSLSQGGGSSTISPTSATTNASGQATFTVRSTKAETVAYAAVDTTDNVTVTQTASVTFTPGAADAAQSTVTVSQASVTANWSASSTLTVTIKDANDNPIPGHAVNLTQGSGSSGIFAVDSTTNANGQAVFTLRSTKAEAVTYTAVDTTTDMTVTQTASVTFTPGAANAAHSTLAASEASAEANGTSSSTLTVAIKDVNDNPLSGHAISLTQGGGSSVITAVDDTTDADGQAVFAVSSTKAEAVTYTAVDTTAGVTVTQTASVTFTPGAASAAQSTLAASVASVTADGTSGSTLTVTIKDANDNPITGHAVSLTQGSGSSVVTAVNPTTDADGQAVFTVTNTKAEAVTYIAEDTTDNVTVTQTASVTFNPGAADAALSTLTASQASVTADGAASSTLTVTITDANDNPITGHTISLTQGSGSSVITAVNSTTDADGQAVFTVTNARAETVTYTAEDTTDNVTIDQTAQVAFTRLPSGGGGGGGGSTATVSRSVIDLNGTSFDPDKIDTAKPAITFEVTAKNGVAYASFPASILASLEGNNAAFMIEIKTQYGSYQIPVNLASLIPGLEELLIANNLKPEDISFKINLIDMSGNEDIREALASRLPNGRTMGSIVDFSIDIINNSTGKVIGAADQFTQALVRIIPMPKNVTSMPKQWGAFRYNESAKQFEFVPAQSVRIDGVWYAMIHSYSNSVYVVANNEVGFTDARSHWSKPFVQLAAAKGLVNGVGGGKYAPDKAVTRAEFAAMLVHALGRGTSTGNPTSPYGDVRPGAWYYGAVTKARQLGLLDFAEGNNFMPDRPLTREEMASMMAAAIALNKASITKELVNLDGYKDIGSMNTAYLEDVRLMVKLNIMTGTGEDTFDPKGESTRAQAAVVFVRMLQSLDLMD